LKLHRVLVDAVIDCLDQIFNYDKYADKVIELSLKSNSKWGARDRAFIAENTYEIVRNKRFLTFILNEEKEDTKLNLEHLFSIYWYLKHNVFPEGKELKFLENKIVDRKQKAEEILKIKVSIPDWLDEFGESELNENWEKEITALHQEAKVVLRTNTLKTNKIELQRILESEGVETKFHPEAIEALILNERQNIFKTDAFKNGLFEVQDVSSQLVAAMLAPEPGMRVVDACAGAGGKTLHLSALMQNKGLIVAMDTGGWKLKELKKRAARAGCFNIETREITSNKVIKRLANSADRLLLDVPCSGLGVLRRNPDSKWKLSLETINRTKEIQLEIICSYATMLKVGGKMVYATCSILPSENEKQIQLFLENYGNSYKLIEEKKISPSVTGFDGFYMALIERV
jgi:16S rRNA (cytosine967-C5)-methyltransferase